MSNINMQLAFWVQRFTVQGSALPLSAWPAGLIEEETSVGLENFNVFSLNSIGLCIILYPLCAALDENCPQATRAELTDYWHFLRVIKER